MVTITVYEVVEHVHPHVAGWPRPPDVSHGLFNSEERAKRSVIELASRGIRSTQIKERKVIG